MSGHLTPIEVVAVTQTERQPRHYGARNDAAADRGRDSIKCGRGAVTRGHVYNKRGAHRRNMAAMIDSYKRLKAGTDWK